MMFIYQRFFVPCCRSIFQAGWATGRHTQHETDKWGRLRTLRNDVNKALEQARAAKVLGSSLEGQVRSEEDDMRGVETKGNETKRKGREGKQSSAWTTTRARTRQISDAIFGVDMYTRGARRWCHVDAFTWL